jgi:hypothetical protein
LKLIGRLVGNSLPQSTAWVKRRTDLLKLRDLILVINAMQKICWPQKIIVACVLFVDIISSYVCGERRLIDWVMHINEKTVEFQIVTS